MSRIPKFDQKMTPQNRDETNPPPVENNTEIDMRRRGRGEENGTVKSNDKNNNRKERPHIQGK